MGQQLGEAEIRAAVESRVREREPAGTRIVHEMGLFQSAARIDVASINGRLVGWEIKSAADSLKRLPKQARIYSQVFERMWLVVDDRHIEDASALVPGWWGLLRPDATRHGARLRVLRRSRLNPDVDLTALVRLLWRSEALEELSRLGLAAGLERAPRRELWAALAAAVPDTLSSAALKRRVRDRLKYREGWRSDSPHERDGD